MNKELKPCPFCGWDAIVLQNDEGYYYVGCKNAECRGYVFYSYVYYSTQERAIEAWNTRKPMDKVVEQLEENKILCGEIATEAIEMNDLHLQVGARSQIVAFEEAIEIVKGGRNDA